MFWPEDITVPTMDTAMATTTTEIVTAPGLIGEDGLLSQS